MEISLVAPSSSVMYHTLSQIHFCHGQICHPHLPSQTVFPLCNRCFISLVFAMPILHQTIFEGCMVSIRGGAVQTHTFHFDSIHLQRALPKLYFQTFPSMGITQTTQYNTQTVIVAFHLPDGLLDKMFLCLSILLNPFLDSVLTMSSDRMYASQRVANQPLLNPW